MERENCKEADKEEPQDKAVDVKQTKEEKSAIKGEGQDPFEYWGFLPADDPLSDTDSEAGDPVKERQDRVLRSRKVSLVRQAGARPRPRR